MCNTVPAGVVIASITESGILCELAMNSILNFPKCMVCPGFTVFNSVLYANLCSSNLFLINPNVNFVPYIGAFTCFKKYGTPPI